MAQIKTWKGYDFEVYPVVASYESRHSTNWPDLPVVYIFVREHQGLFNPLYVGQTISFRDRIANHQKWPRAYQMGANQIHLRLESEKYVREMIEKHLIDRLNPALNDTI